MTLADVTRQSVLAAIEEFDRIGRFGKARSYYLDSKGRQYDSKQLSAMRTASRRASR